MGRDHSPSSPALRHLTAAELQEEQSKGTLLLDIRPARPFAKGFIRDAIQIGLQGPFASWAAILISPSQSIVVLSEHAREAEEARTRLARVGLRRVIGYSPADRNQWHHEGIRLVQIGLHPSAGLPEMLRADPSIQLIDVRSPSEWAKGHLPGAISLPLLDIYSRLWTIDPARPTLVYCHEGFRATTAASVLRRNGIFDIGICMDGIEGWLRSGLPLEIPSDE